MLSKMEFNQTAVTVQALLRGRFIRVAELPASQMLNLHALLRSLEVIPGLELSQALIDHAIHENKAIIVLFCKENNELLVDQFKAFAFENYVE